MSTLSFKFYLDQPNLDWTCLTCSLPRLSDSFFSEEMDSIDRILEASKERKYVNQQMADISDINNEDNTSEFNQFISRRKEKPSEVLLIHLNINSLQNKFEELKSISDEAKPHIIFISETKIDGSYPNDQFNLPGYYMYRRDRKKGGGGLLAYLHSTIPSKELKLPKTYKTFEALAVEVRLGNLDMLFIGIYRPPKVKQVNHQYFVAVEEELNDICMWASLKKQAIVITGDLNMDRLRPDRIEGKVLLDLEEVHDLQCLITKPTRVTPTSETLLDVILTNKPQLFKQCGAINPEISDHHLIYGIIAQSIYQHRRKTVSFRSLKNVDKDLLHNDLLIAPWCVGEIFDSPDNQYDYLAALLNSVLDKNAPRKKIRVREKDVPYMTSQWQNAIRQKRKYAQNYARNRSPENWELKRKWRNIATRERRKAIKNYWTQKSDELKTKPRDYFKTFNPFLRLKGKQVTNISLRVNENIVTDQQSVVEVMGDYFSKWQMT